MPRKSKKKQRLPASIINARIDELEAEVHRPIVKHKLYWEGTRVERRLILRKANAGTKR